MSRTRVTPDRPTDAVGFRVHLFGASGSGTTTLGRRLATAIGARHLDADDYYWLATDPPFTTKRAPAARVALIERDVADLDDWVLSGSLCSWGDPLVPRFTLAVFVVLDPGVRMARLAERERARYGPRILPRGDLHAQHVDFMDWARSYDHARAPVRSLDLHERWMARLPCTVLRLDASRPVEALCDEIVARIGPGRGRRLGSYAGAMEVLRMTDDFKVDGADDATLTPLPAPSLTGAVSLEEALARRRSVRAFGSEPMTLEQIGQLAWSAQGVTDPGTGYRTAPTAGGTLPIEVDLLLHGVAELEDGVYRYVPAVHALRRRLSGDQRAAVTDATLSQGFVRDAPVVLALSAVAARTAPKFGAFTDRLIDMEVGHVGQNVSLQAVALGLATVVVAGFREAELAAALGLAEGERPVYLMPVGRAG